MSQPIAALTDEQIREMERQLADQKQERECAKWDAELVGRYFRIIRAKEKALVEHFYRGPTGLPSDDYVTLEESLAVGTQADRYVYADVAFIHVQSRDGRTLTCSGFQVSHTDRKEPYLKIQPTFYSYSDFRQYLGSWNDRTGPTKHFDEVPKEEYTAALENAVNNFTSKVSELKVEGDSHGDGCRHRGRIERSRRTRREDC